MDPEKTLEVGRPEFKKVNNESKAVQIQRPKEPSELQQIYVRKLMIAIQTVLTDFASSEQKCNANRKEEERIATDIEKAHCNIGHPPKVDSPEYIKWKKLRWEQTILLACNQYFETLKKFKIENEEFVSTLKKFHHELERVLNRLVAVQPLPESMKNKIKGEKELFNLDASIKEEASRHVKKTILNPIPEIGIKQHTVQLSTVLEDNAEVKRKESFMANKEETGTTHKPPTVIEVIPPADKTVNQEVAETIKTGPVVLTKKQKRLREKYSEAALNPLLPENAEVVIYTDGSLISTNKNTEEIIESGGYAAILVFRKMNDAEIMISGYKRRPSAPDYMELLAISKALKRLKKYKIEGRVVLYSDALGVVDNFNTKLAGWKDCGWKRENGKYIRYWKLWKKIWKNSKRIDLRVCWVKGHAESKLNIRCDEIARTEARLRAI